MSAAPRSSGRRAASTAASSSSGSLLLPPALPSSAHQVGSSSPPTPSPYHPPTAEYDDFALLAHTPEPTIGGAEVGVRKSVEGSLVREGEKQRLALIDKVNESAEAAKLTRAFQQRLALASLKLSRGWTDKSLDVLEPALAQESLRRQQEAQAHAGASHAPSSSHGAYGYPREYEGSMGPPNTKRPRSSDYSYQSQVPSGPGGPFRSSYGHYNLDHSHPQPSTSHLPQNGLSPYGPPPTGPNPFHQVNSLQRYDSPSYAHLNGAQHASQRRPLSAGMHSFGGPNGMSNGRATGPGTPNAISSADPSFNQFVDAASVLSGLGGTPGRASRTNSAERAHKVEDGNRTPPRDKGKSAANGSGAVGEGNSADAAELMLFLAASPSPVQAKRDGPSNQLLGGVSPMRGRRLFSGPEQAEAEAEAERENGHVFGDFADRAPSAYTRHSPPPPHAYAQHQLGLGAPPGMPSTPGRDRQPSFGAPGGAWETYVNASPSPSPVRTHLKEKGAESPTGALGGQAQNNPMAFLLQRDEEEGMRSPPELELHDVQANGSKRPFAVPASAKKKALAQQAQLRKAGPGTNGIREELAQEEWI